MKQTLIVVLSLFLAGCGALAPAAPTLAPTSTPQVILQTVMVTVVVTQFVTYTPSSTPTATLTPIPTLTPQSTALTATATVGGTGSATAAATSATPQASATVAPVLPSATLPADAGGGLFTSLNRSTDHLGMNCQPDTITFTVSTTNTDVAEVDLFYRMEDRLSSSISNWVDIGKMTSDQNGNFTMDFTAALIDRDLRSRKGWLDYQFVGLNKLGAVLGRSAKIVKQINYSPDCSG